MKTIERDELKKLLDQRDPVALIDVLSEESYEDYHLPEAINIPAKSEDFDRRVQQAVPDKDTPVVVYCLNHDCPASPQAGERLEGLGYQEVYDYAAGKEDWRDAELPVVSGAAAR